MCGTVGCIDAAEICVLPFETVERERANGLTLQDEIDCQGLPDHA
jgi:hypothetical protein